MPPPWWRNFADGTLLYVPEVYFDHHPRRDGDGAHGVRAGERPRADQALGFDMKRGSPLMA